VQVCRALFSFAALGALISSCATAGGARSSDDIGATIQDRIVASGGLVWDAQRPLTWTDFRGVAPIGGDEGALTGYNLLFGMGCTGAAFHFEAAAVFLPRDSWVKPVVLANPELRVRTLRHEQTHFDLTEVHARRVRRYLAGADSPCRGRLGEIRDGAERLVAAEGEAQHRYDDETRHGLNAQRQLSWDRDVTGWLTELAAYRTSAGVR
jgi:hypothetical protein